MLQKNYLLNLLRLYLFIGFLMGCATQASKLATPKGFPAFLQEGHRGTRGLMPENTAPAMRKALDVGANVLEIDVHISHDKQVVVAHDPYINRNFSLLPNGQEIPKEDAQKYLLFQMNYEEIRKFDVGTKIYPAYAKQQKMAAYIPLLSELIDSVEQYTKTKKLTKPIYNIEIKSHPEYDGTYQPAPAELVKLVMTEVTRKKIDNRFYVQSFDIRQLQEMRRQYPHVVLGFLTNDKSNFNENIAKIGFKPHIYSPQYKIATPELVQQCHAAGIKIIPWTVNTLEEIRVLKAMQVDGIITDYPDLFSSLL